MYLFFLRWTVDSRIGQMRTSDRRNCFVDYNECFPNFYVFMHEYLLVSYYYVHFIWRMILVSVLCFIDEKVGRLTYFSFSSGLWILGRWWIKNWSLVALIIKVVRRGIVDQINSRRSLWHHWNCKSIPWELKSADVILWK